MPKEARTWPKKASRTRSGSFTSSRGKLGGEKKPFCVGKWLLRVRGTGAFGQVWEANSPDGHLAAFKSTSCDPATRVTELRNSQKLSHLRHPNLVQIERVCDRERFHCRALRAVRMLARVLYEVRAVRGTSPCHGLRTPTMGNRDPFGKKWGPSFRAEMSQNVPFCPMNQDFYKYGCLFRIEKSDILEQRIRKALSALKDMTSSAFFLPMSASSALLRRTGL